MSPQLRDLVQLLADERAPEGLRRWLGGGSLMGIGKPGVSLEADARPIVIGETFRKLVFKVTLRADLAQVRDHLQPHQLAVGTPAGVEAVIHSTRRWLKQAARDNSAVLLQRDVANAFNTALPSQFLLDCREHMPASAKFAEYCYGRETALVYRGRLEASSRGQQGCPAMGPLFCLMRARMSTQAQQLAGAAPAFSPEFADDSYCGGRWDAMLAVFKQEIELAQAYGLQFDMRKCRLHIPAGDAFEGDASEFARLGVTVSWGADVEMLRAPVAGSAAFVDAPPASARRQSWNKRSPRSPA